MSGDFRFGPIPPHQLVKDDVDHVIQHATVVISLSSEGPMSFINPNPKLSVLAVIGPGVGGPSRFRAFYKQAVLLEVGLGVSRPYHESKTKELNERGKLKYTPKRRKWFHLTAEQYEQVAPVIFSHLQEITNQEVAQWKCNHKNPFFIPTPRHYFSRRQKTLFIESTWKPWPRGTRFAVSLEDRFILSDIYWAEKHNDSVRYYLQGLAKGIDLRLNFNNYEKISPSKPGRNISETERFKQVVAILKKKMEKRGDKKDREEKLPNRYIVDLLDYLPRRNGERRSRYYYAIAEALGYTGEELREEKFVRQVLPGPQKRLNNIQLRITTGLSRRDHIVFEITSNLSDLNEELGVTSTAPVP